MKIKIILFIVLFLSQKSFNQSKDWQTYDLDSIVFLDMPFNVYELDTIIELKKYYKIYSNKDSSEFVAQKIYVGKSYSNIETHPLPKDFESLKKYYLDFIWAFEEITEYKMQDYKLIQKNNLKGYEILFVNNEDILVQQIVLFLVNKNLYLFSYINENGLNEFDKKTFFNNINFDDSVDLSQYPNKLFFSNKNLLLILLILLFTSFIFRFKSKSKKVA